MTVGTWYYCVSVDKSVAKSGEIYFMAEAVEISGAGDMMAYNKEGLLIISIAAGKWNYVRPASMIDGGCCQDINHWD